MSKLDFILADTTNLALFKGLDLVMEQSQQNKFKNYVVLIPDSKTIMAEKYLLSICKNKAFSNIYIYSLKRLLNKISPLNNKLVLSKSAGTMIVRKIVLSNLDKLVCFKKTANTNGFAETIYGTISQLKSSGVSVADFYEMASGVRPSLKIKMQDIALLYDEYQKFIENHYIDQSDLYYVLQASINQSTFVANSHIYFLGYESVTTEALNVCKELIKYSKSFIVSASYMYGGANSHIADNEVYTKFKQIADQHNFAYIPKRYKHKFSADFEHIKDNLYAYPAKVKNKTNSIEILSATNIQSEIDFVAQKISALVKSGVKYKDIAVIVNQIENYHDKLDQIFSEYNFSYFISKPYDYSMHPLFKLIKSYIEICRKNYDVADCIEFLSNILINNTNYLDDFINYVNQYGINHNKFTTPFTAFDDKILSQEQFNGIESLRQTLVNSVQHFKAKKSTAGEYVNAIKEFLEYINIVEKLNMLEAKQQNDIVFANITRQAKTKLDAVLDQIQTFLYAEEMGLEMFQNILISGLSVTDVSLVPVSQDYISVSNNADGLYNIDYLFIVNATEGNFPVKQPDCGIIVDSEITELNGKSSKTIEPTIRTINRRERYKAYETLLLPNKKLYFSYNNGSGENVLKESNIIDQIINMFGGKDCVPTQKYLGEFNISAQNYMQDVYTKLCTPKKAIKYLCAEVGNKRAYLKFDNIKLVQACYHASKRYMPANLKQVLDNLNTENNYIISNTNQLYFKNNTTSTSQLEKYFSCPFLFFTNYGLRLKENLSSKLKALDVGNILHKVAEIFVAKLIKNPQLNVQTTAKQIVNNIISKEYVIDDNKFLLKIVSAEAIRLCEKLQKENVSSFFKPVALEQQFGKTSKYGSVKLQNGQILLEGKIDRIDVYNNRFRIIDYKTGKIEDNIKRVYYGKKIQLVTYLLAMQNTGLKPAGVVYFPIRNEFAEDNVKTGRMKGFFVNDADIAMKMDTTISEETPNGSFLDLKINKPKNNEYKLRNSANLLTDVEFDNLQRYVQQLCDTAVTEILQGNIAPSPIKLTDSEKLLCEHCVFAGVCGVEKTTFARGRKCYTDVKIEDISKIKGDENGK